MPQMPHAALPGPMDGPTPWLALDTHRAFLRREATRQIDFFRPSLRASGGFHVLDLDGAPLPSPVQELHSTTRMVHSFALAKLAGAPDCDALIDQGMAYLWTHHRDTTHGGYMWGLSGDQIHDDRKLAYGHVFVLLAGSSAKLVGHPDADRLIENVSAVLDTHFWQDGPGLFCDEWNRDWTPFSSYRGLNANMHGVEALLAAYEATDQPLYLDRAGRILDFLMHKIAPAYDWRLPEHYTDQWQVDPDYSGNPMFRPAGTTPGHSFELARLWLHYWDLRGQPDDGTPERVAHLTLRSLQDAWRADGGLVYTLTHAGTPDISDRYWWPVTEAIGVLAALLKHAPTAQLEHWYRQLWAFACAHFIDHDRGGWFPEIDAAGRPTMTQFAGKPDIYHALQATLFPLAPGLSRLATALPDIYAPTDPSDGQASAHRANPPKPAASVIR